MAAADSARKKARKAALDILFEIDLRENDWEEVLATHTQDTENLVRPYTELLVKGVLVHLEELDGNITAALRVGWSLTRMPRVDRNLARIAVFELHHTDLDRAIVISEAVRLARELSTDESPAFLNGLLASL